MITKKIHTLPLGAVKLALYVRRRLVRHDVLIGLEVLAKDGSVLEWMGETEAVGTVKADTTVEVESVKW